MFERYKNEDLWCLLYPIAWVDEDSETWFTIDLPQRVQQAGYHVVGANWSIDNDKYSLNWTGYGHSTIYDNTGHILSTAKLKYGSEIVLATLPNEKRKQKKIRDKNDCQGIQDDPFIQDGSSDLLDPSRDPNWTRRTKSYADRFCSICEIDFQGHTLQFEQGTVTDSTLLLYIYIIIIIVIILLLLCTLRHSIVNQLYSGFKT